MAAPASYARRSLVGNAAATTVPLGLASGDGSCAVASATNWPSGSGGNFLVVIDRGQNTEELAWCSGVSGTTLTFSQRGAQGTSGVAHSAGCTIALSMGTQDLDEANQVVSAVLGQSGAAKGDIPVILSAAGPNTMTRLGVGSNGAVLSAASGTPAYTLAGTSPAVLQSAGSSVPVWTVLPGSKLASKVYAPASLQTVALTTTLTATDTTNHTVSFTVPASGNVDVEVQAYISATAASGQAPAVALALKNHSGGAQLNTSVGVAESDNTTTPASIGQLCRARFELTGLTPGAFQIDLAAVVTTTSGGAGANLFARGVTANTVSTAPLIMAVFAA